MPSKKMSLEMDLQKYNSVYKKDYILLLFSSIIYEKE